MLISEWEVVPEWFENRKTMKLMCSFEKSTQSGVWGAMIQIK
jgi:hypothetical protein